MFVILFTSIVTLIYVLHRSPMMEGFAVKPTKEEIPNPAEVVSDVLRTAMGPIRKASRHVLNPQLWMDRLSMIGKSPLELARQQIKADMAMKNTIDK